MPGHIWQPAFKGPKASTVNIGVTGSSQHVAFATAGNLFHHLRVFNAGSVTIFIEFGDNTVAAAVATGFPIPAGAVEIVGIPGSATNVAAIAAVAGPNTMYFTPGEGL